MTLENNQNQTSKRHHDILPTVATKKGLKGWVEAYQQTPIGKEFPLPKLAILENEQTALVKEKKRVIRVRVHEVHGELKPGQQVILYKKGVDSDENIPPEMALDLSKINLENLHKIEQTKGIPQHILDEVYMLIDLSGDEMREPVGGAEAQSKEWTIPTSPRTKQRIENIIK
jgi:hypothetical protein